MSTTTDIGTLIAIVAVGFVGLAFLRAKVGGNRGMGSSGKFKAKRLLSPNELEFICRLESAAPELRFHAQVSMGAVLDPAVPRSNGKAYMSIRGMFAQKIIDFVAQDKRTGNIVAIIELDDRTHNGAKDAKRDAMLSSAGYRTIRWNSKSKPDSSTIRFELFPQPPAVASLSDIANRLEPSL